MADEMSVNCSGRFIPETNTCVSKEEFQRTLYDYLAPQWHEIVFIVLFVLVFIVGIAGNVLVCYVVLKNRKMRTVTNVFILNLSSADLMVLLLVLPPTMAQDIFESWFLGDAGCKIMKFLQRVSVIVSVLTLTAISIERFYAICYPLRFKATNRRARLIILGIWLVAVAFSAPDLKFFRANVPDWAHLTSLMVECRALDPNKVYFGIYIGGLFVLPCVIMTVIYVRIARCLWESTLPLTADGSSRNGQDGAWSQLMQRRRVARMLIAVVVCFFVCYFLHHTVIILYVARLLSHIEPPAMMAIITSAHLLIYVNSAMNPIIYNFMSENFRREFKAACGCCQTFKGVMFKTQSSNQESVPLNERSRKSIPQVTDQTDIEAGNGRR